ncbi:MAG: hypothetical protein ACLFPL_02025 [Candidatus Nanoarchaeia archaeon]
MKYNKIMDKGTLEYLEYLKKRYGDIDFNSKLISYAKRTGENFYEIQGINSLKVEIQPPKIEFVQYAEPHILISDYYIKNFAWYELRTLIGPLAEESFLAYYTGMYLSSISCIANCCEYILKFEFFKSFKYDSNLTLGSFISKNNTLIKKFIEQIKIDKFETKIFNINQIRNGYFHFNTEKLFKINDNNLPTSQEFDLIKINKEMYDILNEILEYFYLKSKKEIVLECLIDFKSKKKEIFEKLKEDKMINPFGEEYYKKKFEHKAKEFHLDISYE